MQHYLPATQTGCDTNALLPLHGFSPEGFFSANSDYRTLRKIP
ncbi:hypothetical protein CSB66_2558 [Enterobacter hormaechei]|jgi:hypothetical protein|nr:hypothetical protein CSB66_2558 [Enterobacter hormaechei]